MTTILRFSVLMGSLFGGTVLAADPAAPPVLPDAEYPRLLGPSVQTIVTSLAGEPTRRGVEKARVAALMLAEFAQQNLGGADGQQRATVRDAAVQVAALIKDKKYAEAVKLAQQLPTLPANPAARRDKVKLLGTLLDVEELMGQFRSPKVGGLGIETLLDDLGNSKGGLLPPEALTDSLRLLAYQTAVAADLSRQHVPDKKAKDWQAYAEAMRKSALQLGTAVGTKDGKGAFSAIEQLNTSCNKCHKEFR
jgi:hypothetical protein